MRGAAKAISGTSRDGLPALLVGTPSIASPRLVSTFARARGALAQGVACVVVLGSRAPISATSTSYGGFLRIAAAITTIASAASVIKSIAGMALASRLAPFMAPRVPRPSRGLVARSLATIAGLRVGVMA